MRSSSAAKTELGIGSAVSALSEVVEEQHTSLVVEIMEGVGQNEFG